MVWAIILVGGLLIVGALVILILLPMRIPRQPEREGEQKGEAVSAYAGMGRGPLFKLERYLVLRALSKTTPRGILLDLGCGPGFLTVDLIRRYSSLKIIGLDINREMLNFAREKKPNGVDFVLGDAQQLPLADNSLDGVVTSLSLHHWAEAQTVLDEIKRVLKPGGCFLVFDLRRNSSRPVYWAIIIGQIFSPAAIRRTNGGVGSFWSSYTPSELRQILSQTNFADFQIESHLGWMIARGIKAESG